MSLGYQRYASHSRHTLPCPRRRTDAAAHRRSRRLRNASIGRLCSLSRRRYDFVESAYDGSDCPWKLDNGCMEVVPGTGDITSTESFGDLQLHLEFASPWEIKGNSQGRGNSGIFLANRYEIQVLDNFENPTYADGTVGASLWAVSTACQCLPVVPETGKPTIFCGRRRASKAGSRKARFSRHRDDSAERRLHPSRRRNQPDLPDTKTSRNGSRTATPRFVCRIMAIMCAIEISGCVVSRTTTNRNGSLGDWVGGSLGNADAPSFLFQQ